MKLFFKIFIFLLITISLSYSTTATISYLGNISAWSISEDTNNNKLFIECIREQATGLEGCSNIGSDITYAKYNLNTLSFSRYDTALVGVLPASDDGAYSGTYHPNYDEYSSSVEKYFKYDGDEYLIVNHNFSTIMYKYNTNYNYWALYHQFVTQYTNSVFRGFSDRYFYTNSVDGTYAFSGSTLYYFNSTKKPETMVNSLPNQYSFLKRLTPYVNDYTYTPYITLKDGVYYNETVSTLFTIYKGWSNQYGNDIVGIDTNAHIIVSSNLYQNYSTDYSILSPTCATERARQGSTGQIVDMDCASATDCLFVGYNDTNDAFAYAFDGDVCYGYDLTQVTNYNPNNKILYAVNYVASKNKFYVVGQESFLSFDALEYIPTDISNFSYTVTIDENPSFYQQVGNFIITNDQKYTIQDNGIIYVYPASGNSPQLTYIINSTSNGYSKTICALSQYDNELIDSETFNDCTSTLDCGFFPNPSSYNWYTAIKESSFDKSLILYNDTFSFHKYLYMPDIYLSDYFNFLTTYDYFSGVNASTVFTIITPYNYELINVYMELIDDEICYYKVLNSITLSNKTLLYCGAYDGTKYTSNSIFLDTSHFTWYITSIIDNIEYTSSVYPTNTEAYSQSGIKISTVENDPETYIDNIKVYGTDNDLDMTAVTVPYEKTCFYSIGDCVTTRVYFSWISTDFNNYEDFRVCGISYTNATAYIPSPDIDTGTDTGLVDQFGNPIIFTQGQKLLYGLFIMLLILLGITFLGMYAGQPKIGFFVGIGLAVFSMIVMSIPTFPLVGGFIPAWVTIFMFLVAILLVTFMMFKNTGQQG